MQIECKRYSCQKSVEVCYWVCKFRKSCKDWQNGLKEEPGLEAIESHLKEAAKKKGRAFDPIDLVIGSGNKKLATN